jgi:hypothetical protein
MMYDLCWVQIVAPQAGRLAWSALPDAPVVAPAPHRERGRLRRLAGRLATPRPRLHVPRLTEEDPCGT